MIILRAAARLSVILSIAIAASAAVQIPGQTSLHNEGRTAAQLAETNVPMTSDTTKPELMHVVHFWLEPELSEEEIADFLKGVRSLAEVPTVRDFWLGKPAGTPSRGVVDNSFDYSLVVWFDDVAGHDAYQEHPIHLAFVEAHEAKFARVRVRDSSGL